MSKINVVIDVQKIIEGIIALVAHFSPVLEGVITCTPVLGFVREPDDPDNTIRTPAAPESIITTPSAPENTVTAPIELDSSGLPWDARINAEAQDKSHPKVQSGKWKAKRGIDKALVASVEAELRAANSAGPAGPGTDNTTPLPATDPAGPAGPGTDDTATDPGAPLTTLIIDPNGPITFPDLIRNLQPLGGQYGLTTEALNVIFQEECVKLGASGFPYLAGNAALIPPFWSAVILRLDPARYLTWGA